MTEPISATPLPFFGLGAMRAGTTWLSELLRRYPDCAMTPFKEIHFFDVRYGTYGALNHYRLKAKRLETLTRIVAKRMALALAKIVENESEDDRDSGDEDCNGEPSDGGHSTAWTDELRNRFFSHANVENALRRISDLCDYLSLVDNESYVRYLRRYGANANAFGEITPTYGLLPASGFAEIDSLFPGARFIFIMRDPVERLWSHVRFRAGKNERRGRRHDNLNEEFLLALDRPNMIKLSSYQHTIRNLESVIPADRILYLFSERMTSLETGPAEVRRIEAALGLDPVDIDPKIFSTPVNSSNPGTLDPKNRAAAAKTFEPVYSFVQQRFGLPQGWHAPGLLS